MKQLLLLFLVLFVLSSAACYAEIQLNLQDIFWDNLRFNSAPIDLSKPLPDCKSGASPYCNPSIPNIHSECWKVFWYDCDAELTWNDIKIYAKDKNGAPNYNDWVHWDYHGIDVWADYFTEMYYESGPNNPLSSDEYDDFWLNLRLDGKPVDPYKQPANYDASLDYYADSRQKIGYHWYWEYYLTSQFNSNSGDKHSLEWNNISFDITTYLDNYIFEDDPLPYNRMQRGYLKHWADTFLNH